ncbi:MAG TPA: hypothetical protein VFN06_07805, partial [Gaiellaceae bacterium]|nr:hypothetical protein [Gaiellaceae bacterium]
VADLSRDAPIFLLCVARTELLDARPGWGGGKINATSLLLEPLGPDECAELMGRLGAHVEDELRERITSASAGNPLYVEEMLAMVREHGGDGEIVVPPTIHALLQSRIDSLDSDVRVVMERGSVEGEVFHRGAVAVLSPDPVRPDVGTHLTTLVRKELIRSTSPTFPDDEGFRFRHLLIRDAAYESLPKSTRAELHERFGDWLSAQELVERDEIVGYHLEQAYRYRAELDPADPALRVLADGVAARLGGAGRVALERGDIPAALTLLRRAAAVLPESDDRRHELAPHLAFALWDAGDFAAGMSVLADGRAASDPSIAAVCAIFSTVFERLTSGVLSVEQVDATKEDAYRALAEAGDDEGLALYWWSVANEHWFALNATETMAASERGLEHMRRAGKRSRFEVELIWLVGSASVLGPMHVEEALERLGELEENLGDSALLKAGADGARARLLACQGHVGPARELARSARATTRSAGATVTAAGMAMYEAWIEQRAGDLGAWERALRAALDELEGSDDRAFRATIMVYLAQCLYEQGRYDDAYDLCAVVRETSPPDDVVNFVYADAIEGAVRVRRGEDEGLELLGQALERADGTDFFFVRAETRLLLADAHAIRGEMPRATARASEALDIYDAKGDVTGAARARQHLARLGLENA